jgi:hypothetical protein
MDLGALDLAGAERSVSITNDDRPPAIDELDVPAGEAGESVSFEHRNREGDAAYSSWNRLCRDAATPGRTS